MRSRWRWSAYLRDRDLRHACSPNSVRPRGKLFLRAPIAKSRTTSLKPIIAAASALSLIACGTRSHIVARNPALTLVPTCADAVPVYPDREHVPYDYYEVALISAEANSVYNGNGDLLKSMRGEAAGVG